MVYLNVFERSRKDVIVRDTITSETEVGVSVSLMGNPQPICGFMNEKSGEIVFGSPYFSQ